MSAATFTIANLTAYLRIAGLSVALWDFLGTIPGEIRLYHRQASATRLSVACILFIAIRYLSVVALSVSSVGFFSTFTPDGCRRFHLVVPIMKMIANLVSQIILGVRTYAISRRSRWVFWTIIGLFIFSLPIEIVGNVVDRVFTQNSTGNCTSGNPPGKQRAWFHYMAAMIYDAASLGIASFYLYTGSVGVKMMTGFTKSLLEDGMIYFFALTMINIVNVILFRQKDVALQSACATPGQAFTMIFSQKLLLNLSSPSERSTAHHTTPGADITIPGKRDHSKTRGTAPPFGSMFPRNRTMAEEMELGGIRVDKDVDVSVDALDAHEQESIMSKKKMDWEQ